MRSSAHWHDRIRETHHELGFAAMADNGDGPVLLAASKHTATGRHERQKLIEHSFGIGVFAKARTAMPKRQVRYDDILDVHSCLFSAERIATGQHVALPQPSDYDACGLPMVISY